jgi:hypothetical protein
MLTVVDLIGIRKGVTPIFEVEPVDKELFVNV